MKSLKRLLRPLAFLGAACALLVVLGFVERTSARMPVSALKIVVDGTDGTRFVDEDAVRARVLGTAEGIIGTAISDVDITAIEEDLRGIGSVSSADVYRTMDGVLHVRVDQRRPIARVINADGSGFYLTDDGHTMPLSETHTARVMVFTGVLNEPFARTVADLHELGDSLEARTRSTRLLHVARTIHADPLWNALFTQAVVDANGELELVPRVGVQRIRIGDGEHLARRLEKLKTFYHQGIAQTDWRRYAVIDLRFGDQVVCTRRTAS